VLNSNGRSTQKKKKRDRQEKKTNGITKKMKKREREERQSPEKKRQTGEKKGGFRKIPDKVGSTITQTPRELRKKNRVKKGKGVDRKSHRNKRQKS